MVIRIAILWVIGLITIVPYGIYYLLFQAPRDQYALIITLVLFWVFGFWGIVGPIVSMLKMRKVVQLFERTKSREDLLQLIQSSDSRDVVIDLIAAENHVPKFIARRLYDLIVKRLATAGKSPDQAS